MEREQKINNALEAKKYQLEQAGLKGLTNTGESVLIHHNNLTGTITKTETFWKVKLDILGDTHEVGLETIIKDLSIIKDTLNKPLQLEKINVLAETTSQGMESDIDLA